MSERRRRATRLDAAFSAVIGALLCLTAAASAESVTTANGVVQFVSVRARPSSSSTVVAKLHKDEVAELLGTTKYWHKVRLGSGLTGYVSKRWTVVVIEPEATVDRNLVVTFADIDEGDAILIQLGHVDLLVDAGKSNAWSLALEDVLASVDGKLEALFITHPHLDHFGGGAAVLANLDVSAVYTNGEKRGPPRDAAGLPTWEAFEDAVKAEGLSFKNLKVGEVLEPAAGLRLEVLATGSPSGGRYPDTDDGTDINNDSLVLMLEYAGRRVLFTGDIEIQAGKDLVAAHCQNQDPVTCPKLQADVLKVPHHGSASFHGPFFKAVNAGWAVTSAAYNSTAHCLPRAEPNDALLSLGAKLVSTSADGREHVALTIAADGEMSWTMPTKKIFAWRKKAGAGKCGVTKEYEQGQ